MRNRTSGTNGTKFNPDCHQITVYCKRLDRALEKLSRGNTIVFTSNFKDSSKVLIVRYSLPLIHRVKYVDDKGHKFRVAGIGDGRYLPISYGEVGSRGCSGVCWTAECAFFQGCTVTTKYSDSYLYTYPRFEQYPLLDFADDKLSVEANVVDQVILRNVGIFVRNLNPVVHWNYEIQYHDVIDSVPQLLADPKKSPARTAQIFKDYFNVVVETGRESVVVKELPNK